MDMKQMATTPSLGSIALRRFDSNASGSLSPDEVAGKPKFNTAFNLSDTDKSGTLDAAEIDARADIHQRRDARHEAVNEALFSAVADKFADALAKLPPGLVDRLKD